MTKTTMDLSELLAKHDQGDFFRTIAEEAVLQLIMEADVEGLIRCPAGHCAAMSREGALVAMNAAENARPGGTGIESALSIPVWAR